MSKFKVGDEMWIHTKIRITAIQEGKSGHVVYSTDKDIPIREAILEQIRSEGVAPIAPQPAPKFKVGDRVVCDEFGEGIVELVNYEFLPQTAYIICLKNERRAIVDECDLSPAPEPKYYSGKVLAVRTKEDDATPRMQNRVGHVFEIKDGCIVGERWNFDLGNMRPLNSFSEFCKYCSATEWAEVKE